MIIPRLVNKTANHDYFKEKIKHLKNESTPN